MTLHKMVTESWLSALWAFECGDRKTAIVLPLWLPCMPCPLTPPLICHLCHLWPVVALVCMFRESVWKCTFCVGVVTVVVLIPRLCHYSQWWCKIDLHRWCLVAQLTSLSEPDVTLDWKPEFMARNSHYCTLYPSKWFNVTFSPN